MFAVIQPARKNEDDASELERGERERAGAQVGIGGRDDVVCGGHAINGIGNPPH